MRLLFVSFVKSHPEHRPLVALCECGVIDSANTYVWLFSASNSSPFPPLSDDCAGGYGIPSGTSLERLGRFCLICWRGREITLKFHIKRLMAWFKAKRRAERNVCVRESVCVSVYKKRKEKGRPEETLYEESVGMLKRCAHTHTHTQNCLLI